MTALTAEQMADTLLSLQQQVATLGVQLGEMTNAERMARGPEKWSQHDGSCPPSLGYTAGIGEPSTPPEVQETVTPFGSFPHS